MTHMAFGRWRLVSWLAVLLATGCGYPGFVPRVRPRFVPTEPITAANVHRAKPVYIAHLAPYGLDRLHPDPGCALDSMAIDSRNHRFFLHRQRWTAGAIGPVGIHEIDLKTGVETRRTRLPSRPDMTGSKWGSGDEVFFDAGRDIALLDTGYDGISAVVLLDLKCDAPVLLGHDKCSREGWYSHSLPVQPFLRDDRALMVREQYFTRPYGPSDLMLIDLQERAVNRICPVGQVGKELSYDGGIDSHILAHRRPSAHEAGELHVLELRESELVPVRRVTLDPGWYVSGTVAVDRQAKLWIVNEFCPPAGRRLRAYRVPSLDVVREIGGVAAEGRSGCPYASGTSTVGTVTDDESDVLKLYDLSSGREIGRIDIGVPAWADYGGWSAITDPDGVYFGVHGCEWVRLFAVPPLHEVTDAPETERASRENGCGRVLTEGEHHSQGRVSAR